MIRTYSELIKLPTFLERFNYCKVSGEVGVETFGFDRIVNQEFYKTAEWRRLRDQIIIRDNGCDLGIEGREIYGKILIHHLNPLRLNDVLYRTDFLLNPEYLICVSYDTHNAIHYGNEDCLAKDPIERAANDTCPWKIKME